MQVVRLEQTKAQSKDFEQSKHLEVVPRLQLESRGMTAAIIEVSINGRYVRVVAGSCYLLYDSAQP